MACVTVLRPLSVTATVLWAAVPVCFAVAEDASLPQPPPSDAVIRSPAGGSEIVITTTLRVAGAIHSLTWNGKEFIDSHDHRRQLQSASNLEVDGTIFNETFNPTEAGCERDMAGPTSTSRLLWLSATGPKLETISQMAFWLRPGQEARAASRRRRARQHRPWMAVLPCH